MRYFSLNQYYYIIIVLIEYWSSIIYRISVSGQKCRKRLLVISGLSRRRARRPTHGGSSDAPIDVELRVSMQLVGWKPRGGKVVGDVRYGTTVCTVAFALAFVC